MAYDLGPATPETKAVKDTKPTSSSGKQAQSSDVNAYSGATTAVVDATASVLADVAKRRQEANIRRERNHEALYRAKLNQQVSTANKRQEAQGGFAAIGRGLPKGSSLRGLPGYRR